MQIFLARQPIFDFKQNIVGYELFYRGRGEGGSAAAEEAEAAAREADEMATHVIVDAFLGIGLDRVSEGHPAFVKASPEMLLNGSIELLDRERLVLLVEGASPEVEVVEACEALAQAGFRFAVELPPEGEAAERLLRLARIAKLNVRGQPADVLGERVRRLRAFKLQLLADGVESAALRDSCVQLGFTLFQGYRFTRSEVLSQRDLGVDTLRTFQLMKEIRDPNTADARIEEGFRSDVSLTYKLLRIVNSASLGGRNIQSIGHAIRLLGRNALNRWLALLLVSSGAERGVKAEQAYTALLRGRMCELLGEATGQKAASGPLFLLGLFSLLDLLLGLPMEEIVAQMDFAPEVGAALLRREGRYGAILSLVEAYENAEWDRVSEGCRALGVGEYDLSHLYFDAIPWARERTPQAA